jgi:hypothetical protein
MRDTDDSAASETATGEVPARDAVRPIPPKPRARDMDIGRDADLAFGAPHTPSRTPRRRGW